MSAESAAIGIGLLAIIPIALWLEYVCEHYFLALATSGIVGTEIIGAIIFVILIFVFIWIDVIVFALCILVGGGALLDAW